MSLDRLRQADDTIVAVSTPPGRSGLGVVRISGPKARTIVADCFRSSEPYADRLARYGRLEATDGRLVDRVVVTVFQAPRSYTGEDVAEISAHGNPFILKDIERIAVSLGARRATPGEFTLRSVAHGKMDLAQAEAVRDFIAAQTEAQAQTARLQMDGALARRLRPQKDALVQIVAEMEAGIDFSDDDIEAPEPKRCIARILETAATLDRDAESFRYGRWVTEGFYTAIVGKPNVGKSSIFNRLVSIDRAIVTEVAGTTRDVLTETVELKGVAMRFADTAGLRGSANDAVEAIGMDRTLETLAEADLTLVVLDGSRELDREDGQVLERVNDRPHIIAINKLDLPTRWEDLEGSDTEIPVRVSARTGVGIDELERRIETYIEQCRPDSDGFFVTSQRQREALSAAADRLRAGALALKRSVPPEMVLLDLYGALTLLGEVTGEVVTEDILDRVFQTFCIGK